MYRSSTGNLDHYDDGPRGGGGERWDRDRFESMRRRGNSRAGGDEYEHFRFKEHDRYPGGHRDVDFHEDRQRQGTRVIERERFHDDDRYDRHRSGRSEIFHEPTPSEVANQALAPYRRKSIVDRDNIDIEIRERQERSRRPMRPQYIRRQSSLDTYDRKPMARYGDERYEPHEYRLPPNVPIPLPIRERRRSPPRRFHEDEYEDIRYDERSGRGREMENYREVEVSREKSRPRRSKSVAKSTRSSSISSFEEIQPPRATWGKKGKTRLPKRLVKKQAVIDLGYPFQEEDDFIIVTRALEKEHIDEVIKISETYKEEKTTYVYEEKVEVAEPAPPPPPPPPPASVAPPPPPPVLHNPPPPPMSVYAPSERPPSPSVHEHERFVEIERSAGIHGPVTSFMPEHRQIVRRRSERDIRDEIRMLEEERRLLKYERDGEYEIIEARPAKREVIRVDKDRKGRLALVRSAR